MKSPLRFYVMANTYNSYGGHSTLSLIPGFILIDAPDLGTGISELAVSFNFRHSLRPRSSLESLYDEFHARLLALPKVTFRRNRGEASVDLSSELLDGQALHTPGVFSAPLFRAAFAETVNALSLLRPCLKPRDDFALDALLDHCERRAAHLPDSGAALRQLDRDVEHRKATTLAAQSRWEQLGIDWRRFHPEARRILDDPCFWDEASDLAPHGNDTGADLLREYRRWIRRHPADDPAVFYHELMVQWEFAASAADPDIQWAMDEAAVGLAFAEFKLRGNCRDSAAVLARAALQRQRQKVLAAPESPQREECLRYLDLIASKL